MLRARRSGPGGHREKGATLIEFSIVLPLLLLLAFGIVELGVAFKSHLTFTQGAKEASRVAAFVGNDVDADCTVIATVVETLGSDFDKLGKVEIFKVDKDGNPVFGKVNTYTYGGVGDPLDCTKWAASIQWPSVDRQVLAGVNPLDVAGVRLDGNHRWLTQFPPFVGNVGLSEQTVTRLEPEAFE